jgi:predicted nucleotide-binding protein (sugar kinase/HSP70/actin superfamily)
VGRWFSSGTPASSTTKTVCHDIAEILLKVVLNTIDQNPIIILIGKYFVGCVPMGIDEMDRWYEYEY